MIPDAQQHNPDPAYMRQLRNATGLTQTQLARKLGLSRRMVQIYEANIESVNQKHRATYLYQYALERLAENAISATLKNDGPTVASADS